MVQERVEAWHSNNKTLPAKIIFYRDGVSESQFEKIKTLEFHQIREGFNDAAAKCKKTAQKVEIALIVVTKRHHTRFYPEKDVPLELHIPHDALPKDVTGVRKNTADKNCPFGLVVDSDVTDPNYFSFYLQSHQSALGTAKKSHYIVVQNEAALSFMDLQTLVSIEI